MKKALFTGTFDPPTLGHLNIMQRASKLCYKLTIGIAVNLNKHSEPLLPIVDRKNLIEQMTRDLSNVEVVFFEGLVVEFAQKNGIEVLIRGLRSTGETDFEFQMASANREMIGIETLFLMADNEYAQISSSLVREIAYYGHSVEAFVPPEVAEAINRL